MTVFFRICDSSKLWRTQRALSIMLQLNLNVKNYPAEYSCESFFTLTKATLKSFTKMVYIHKTMNLYDPMAYKSINRLIDGCMLRSIRRSVSRPVMTSLVVSLVLTRLDYGSAAAFSTDWSLFSRVLGRPASVALPNQVVLKQVTQPVTS